MKTQHNHYYKKLLQSFHIDSDYKNISAFLDRLQKGNVVNTGVFQNVGVGSVRDFSMVMKQQLEFFQV